MELWELNVEELRSGYARKSFSPLEVVDRLLHRIEALDPGLGAFRQVLGESARREAHRLTNSLAAGQVQGPLHGIPVAVKELFDIEGALVGYGSQVFAGRVGSADATAVERLRAAGAIMLGVTRSHEFGWGITTQHPQLGSTRNPWNPDRVPGGSSGGSAAALAAGMAPLALGTDTGGSVRIPAAFCGVAGIKPTHGSIPHRGVVPLAPSLDHVGPMARNAGDLPIALGALAGFNTNDPKSWRHPETEEHQPSRGLLERIRIGTAPSLHLVPLARDYEEIFANAVTVAGDLGAEVIEVPFPHAERIRPAFTVIQQAEAYHTHTALLATYPSRAPEYGTDVRERLEAAEEVGLSDYLAAQMEARRIRHHFEKVFDMVDVILAPVSPGPPSLVADPDQTTHLGKSISFRDLVMDYTIPQDLTGLPACAIPAGFDSLGLPVGIQITAASQQEDLAMAVAAQLQEALGPRSIPPQPEHVEAQ